jgi:peptidoglycan/xylan/chitin deacetylase (PgdA/CDA1 family)
LNGWKVTDKDYINDIAKAAELIDSRLFRPPYGRITKFQAKLLLGSSPTGKPGFSIIMWSVLAADWDEGITPEKCYQNILRNAKPGSIIVFHDSAKALQRMQYALPKVLSYFSGQGYQFKAISAK